MRKKRNEKLLRNASNENKMATAAKASNLRENGRNRYVVQVVTAPNVEKLTTLFRLVLHRQIQGRIKRGEKMRV